MNPIQIDPEVMHGTPCFAGTRVPIKNLFDLILHNRTLAYFLEQFPSVRPEQVQAVLKMATPAVIATCQTEHHSTPVEAL